jgi:hypothetical protein
MMKFSAILSAQLMVSAVALSISGAAYAQNPFRTEPAAGFTRTSDIACVDGMPAPPWTQICPPTSSASAAFAAEPRGEVHKTRKHTVQ